MRRHRWPPMLAALVLALALAACGTSSAGSAGGGGTAAAGKNTAQPADDTEKMRKFAKCMRDNGVDVPDPEMDSDGKVTFGMGPGRKGKLSTAEKEKMKAAMGKCRHLMPNGGQPPKLSPEDTEKMRKFAQCMRQHGIDMPDPEADGSINFRKGDSGVKDLDDPKFKDAQKACQQYAPGRFMVKRGG